MRSWASLVRFVSLALVWGSSFLWIKIALGGLSPIQITLIRLILGAAVIVTLAIVTHAGLPKGWRAWAMMLVPALFGSALPFTLFAVGELSVDSGIAGVMNSTTPLWALLITVAIGTERNLGVLRTVGLLAGFAGTLVIFAPWQSAGVASWGALVCLVGAISYAVSYAYIGRNLSGKLSSVTLSASQLTGGVVLVAIAMPFTGGLDPVHLSIGPVIAVTILGVMGTGVAFVLNNRLIEDEGVVLATSVGYLIPIVSVLLGVFFLHEELNVRILIGMVVVLAGVALSRRRPSPVTAVSAAEGSTLAAASSGNPDSVLPTLRCAPDQSPGVHSDATAEDDVPASPVRPHPAPVARGDRPEPAGRGEAAAL
jgi:drug/metabolite transporter (DMT)-like permease